VTTQVTPDGYVLRAKELTTLTKALGEVTRPSGKVRVAVQ
jgi:hypothetical protein